MKIYIDFDGTLFDTDKYVKDCMKIFNKYGISKEKFDKICQNVFGRLNLYDMTVIIKYVINEYNISETIYDEFTSLLDNCYVYEDVEDTLRVLKDLGYELYILTYGDKNTQKRKVDSSKLDKYFNGIIITQGNKAELDIDYNNSIFIDNNPNEIEKFYRKIPKLLIRIRRETDKYAKFECKYEDVIECFDFNQVVGIIEREC